MWNCPSVWVCFWQARGVGGGEGPDDTAESWLEFSSLSSLKQLNRFQSVTLPTINNPVDDVNSCEGLPRGGVGLKIDPSFTPFFVTTEPYRFRPHGCDARICNPFNNPFGPIEFFFLFSAFGAAVCSLFLIRGCL